jgi:hypothetical protein
VRDDTQTGLSEKVAQVSPAIGNRLFFRTTTVAAARRTVGYA